MSSPKLLMSAIGSFGLQPVAWVVQMSEQINLAIDERERAKGFPTSTTGRARQATEHSFLTLLTSINSGRSSTDARLPDELRVIVKASVRHGIPLDILMNRVWTVHSSAKDTLTEAIRVHLSPEALAGVLQSISEAAFDFANIFVRQVAAAYEEEERDWRRRRSMEQRDIIEGVLAGDPPPDSADAVLPALWSGRHVVAMAWHDHVGSIDHQERESAEFGARAASELGAANVFMYDRQGLTHFWWNFDANAGVPDLRRLDALSRPTGMRIAVGTVARGVEGFRETYRAAEQSAQLRSWCSPHELVYADDVAHLTMLLSDRVAARNFVRRELGPLAGTETRLSEIRETVRLYLAGGNSRVTVARVLHLAPNTIAYRVGQASELLGRSVNDRATQVLLALQLVDLVPSLLDHSEEPVLAAIA